MCRLRDGVGISPSLSAQIETPHQERKSSLIFGYVGLSELFEHLGVRQ